MKHFNTTGTCYPDIHYMVDLTQRVKDIRAMVERGDYFCINRGRQYGKTTTLEALAENLQATYTVFSISFEELETTEFASETTLAHAFLRLLWKEARRNNVSQMTTELSEYLLQQTKPEAGGSPSFDFEEVITTLCTLAPKSVVIIIDEVDQASNYESFLKFLGILRTKYLKRRKSKTFHSVILAGVYDIKNLKLKIRPEEDHQYNSPWNIAASFDIDMSLTCNGIATMLAAYEHDHHTGMDIDNLARMLTDYTNGYPFLVSRLCQIMDELLPQNALFASPASCWTANGVRTAVKHLLSEQNTLFDDLAKKLKSYPPLRSLLVNMLLKGSQETYAPYDTAQNLGLQFGYIQPQDGSLAIANRIFESWLYNLFMVEEKAKTPVWHQAGTSEKPSLIANGHLNMTALLERFIVHYQDILGSHPEAFKENDGRHFFLMYLLPVINGTGHYYIEPRTRDERRMDIVVNYSNEQFIIELKIWRGPAYQNDGIKQLCDYLDSMHETTGYLVTFNFNQQKSSGLTTLSADGKTIVAAML